LVRGTDKRLWNRLCAPETLALISFGEFRREWRASFEHRRVDRG